MDTSVVGITSILALSVCLACITVSVITKRKTPNTLRHQNEYFQKITKYQGWFSMMNMICITAKVISIMLSYYTPRMFGYCMCKYMTVSCLLFYSVGLYSLKFAFALYEHFEYMILHFRDIPPKSDPFQRTVSFIFGKSRRIIAGTLFIFGIPLAILMLVSWETSCRNSDFGCNITYNRTISIAAVAAFTVEALCFTYFALKVFFNVKKENRFLARRFVRCGILASIFLSVSLIDMCFIVAYPQYETSVLGMIDGVFMVICNVLAFSPICMNVDCCHSRSETSRLMLKEEKQEIEPDHVKVAQLKNYEIPVELHMIPERCEVGGGCSSPKSEPDSKNPMSAVSVDGPNGNITALKSSEFEGSGVVCRCPHCSHEVIIRNKDEAWDRMKLHVIAYHLDDAIRSAAKQTSEERKSFS